MNEYVDRYLYEYERQLMIPGPVLIELVNCNQVYEIIHHTNYRRVAITHLLSTRDELADVIDTIESYGLEVEEIRQDEMGFATHVINTLKIPFTLMEAYFDVGL